MRNFKRKYNTDESQGHETMGHFKTETVKQIVKPRKTIRLYKTIWRTNFLFGHHFTCQG